MPVRIVITVFGVFLLPDTDVSEYHVALKSRNLLKDPSSRLSRNVGEFFYIIPVLVSKPVRNIYLNIRTPIKIQ